MQNSLFGSKESQATSEKRDEKQKERNKELAKRTDLEKRKDGNDVEYTVAASVDPSVQTDYAPASHGDGLEIVGSKEWVKQQKDSGVKYEGYVACTR